MAEAVNELVVNAIVHAYYGSAGSVKVIVRQGSLEISNPGDFLIDRDVAIAGGTSEVRNPALMRIFNFIGSVDRAGSGLQMVYQTWQKEFGQLPDLVESCQPPTVILSAPIPQEGLRVRRGGVSDEQIISLCVSHEQGITPSDVVNTYQVSLSTAQKRLRALAGGEEPLLRRIRNGRGYIYLRS